jgi:RNA polymerase primary sigma factor
MVAHVKRHKSPRSKKNISRRKLRTRKPEPMLKPVLAPSAFPIVEITHTTSEDEEPRPEDLAKEEPIKPAELEDAVRAAAAGEATARAGRSERTSYDGDTAIKLYLREIGQVKLLTPQEEIELAARIKKGDKKAREQMIKANLRLVVKIARDYEGIGLPLLDLISEGNIGLMKAVERFDPAKGGKLSTYGSWWIKQSIKRALANQSKTIRLPVHLVDKISKMRRTAMRLQEELGREPTDDELGEELGTTASRVAQMRMAAVRPASLDAPIGDEDSNNFAEVVQDESADTPYEQLEEKTVTRMLQEMVKTLDPREAIILRARFGLDGGPQKTLEEVGQKFGVTRERVRQIQNIALKKLRKMIERMETTKT